MMKLYNHILLLQYYPTFYQFALSFVKKNLEYIMTHDTHDVLMKRIMDVAPIL